MLEDPFLKDFVIELNELIIVQYSPIVETDNVVIFLKQRADFKQPKRLLQLQQVWCIVVFDDKLSTSINLRKIFYLFTDFHLTFIALPQQLLVFNKLYLKTFDF